MTGEDYDAVFKATSARLAVEAPVKMTVRHELRACPLCLVFVCLIHHVNCKGRITR